MCAKRRSTVRAAAHTCVKLFSQSNGHLNARTNLDVLTALRSATAQRHAALDTRTPLAAATPDLRDYHDHLRLLEAWLESCPYAPAGYLDRIRSDLAHPSLAGMSFVMADAAYWPPQASVSDAYRWGVSYVIEGSQLGGAVLYKRLSQRLALHPLNYLRGAGALDASSEVSASASPGPRWQNFLAALRGAVQTAPQIEQACRGAQQAFDSLIALVDQFNRLSAEPAGHP
jgi:heme oxygenase